MWCLPSTKQLSSSPTPTSCPTIQFSSDTNYPELASDSTGLRANCHRTAPTSQASRKQGVHGTHSSVRPTANSGVPTTPSSGLTVHWVQRRQLSRLRPELLFSFRTCLDIGRCWRTALWWWQVWCLHHCLWDPECHTHWSGNEWLHPLAWLRILVLLEWLHGEWGKGEILLWAQLLSWMFQA